MNNPYSATTAYKTSMVIQSNRQEVELIRVYSIIKEKAERGLFEVFLYDVDLSFKTYVLDCLRRDGYKIETSDIEEDMIIINWDLEK